MMERWRRVFRLALAGALSAGKATAYTPAEDGIYAVFETSAGEIVTRLFFERVPVMAGNFMRLAEGTGKTLDVADGTIRQERFYDGLTFHRVAAPFGIVGGAPGGDPDGGPGYTFPSEIFFLTGPDFEQYSFVEPGRLAMLDTSFNANGSQFFITTEAEPLSVAPVLFGKHSVFGEVVEGMDVVQAIAAAPRAGETPLDPVVIQGVEMIRRGAAAEAFDPFQPTPGALIPEIEPMTTEFRSKDATEGEFIYSREPWSFHSFYTSRDLQNWQNIGVSGLNTGPAIEASVTRSWSEITEAGRYFFRGVRSRGIASLSSQLTGRTLQVLSNGQDPIRFLFEEDFKGRYQIYHAPAETIYEGNIEAWRAWLTGSSIQFVIQFATLVVPTGDDTFLVTQPQQIYLYFDGIGRPLACFSHFLGTDPIFDEDGELIVGALPAVNLPGTWEIFDTVEEP